MIPYDDDFRGWSEDPPLNWDNPVEWDAPPEWATVEFEDVPFDDDFDPGPPPEFDPNNDPFADIALEDFGWSTTAPGDVPEGAEYRGTFTDMFDLVQYLEEIWWLDVYIVEVDEWGWDIYVNGSL